MLKRLRDVSMHTKCTWFLSVMLMDTFVLQCNVHMKQGSDSQQGKIKLIVGGGETTPETSQKTQNMKL